MFFLFDFCRLIEEVIKEEQLKDKKNQTAARHCAHLAQF